MRQRLPSVDSIGYAIKTIVIVVKPFYHFILGIEGLDNAQPPKVSSMIDINNPIDSALRENDVSVSYQPVP